MAKSKDESYSEEEAQRRFERAVDASLRTPPMHRVAKPAAKAKPKTKQGKKKR